MALAAEKLYIRRSGVTQAINLYTSPSDVGSEYLALRHPNGLRYAPIIPTTDGRASYLRVQKSGTTKAVATTAITYVGVWTGAGSGKVNGSSNLVFYFDYNRVFSSSSLFNFRACRDGNGGGYPSYKIDGQTYSTPASGYNYHRLSTGNHTISYTYDWWIKKEVEYEKYSVGQRVV